MKYWIIWYSKDANKYQMNVSENIHEAIAEGIVVFKSFDMAYQYVTRLNCTNDVQAYSKWTVGR